MNAPLLLARNEHILDMWAAATKSRAIAKVVGMSGGAVRSVVCRARVAGDPRAIGHQHGWTDELVARLKVLWDAGITGRAIAHALGHGATKNSVIGKANRLGLAERPWRSAGIKLNPARVWRANEKRAARAAVSPPFTVLPTTQPPAPKPLAIIFAVPNVVPMAPPKSRPVSLLKRTERQCSYIAGEAQGPATKMCGAPVARHSLCAFHVRLCWQAGPKKAPNPNGGSRRSSLVPFVGEVPFS